VMCSSPSIKRRVTQSVGSSSTRPSRWNPCAGPDRRPRVLAEVSPHGISWHYATEPKFSNSEATPVGYRVPRTASEAGGERPTNRRPRVEQTDKRSLFDCDWTRVRIAPGSPFDFAQLADLFLRALRIKSPNQTEPTAVRMSSPAGMSDQVRLCGEPRWSRSRIIVRKSPCP
jgi:hypothetical protein